MRRWTLGWVLLCGSALADASYERHVGLAMGYTDGRRLYDEEHLLKMQGADVLERVVLYRCPDGEPFARKHMRTGAAPLQPTFEMQDARLGYVEGFQAIEQGWEVYFQRAADRPRDSERLEVPAEGVVDAGFDAFVRQRWEALLSGKKLKIAFLVPSRLDFLDFKVQHLRAETEAGEPAQVFRLALSGMLGWFVDGIDVWYADADRRLLRFDGLSNVRAPDGANYTARIRFPKDRIQSGLDPADWEAALNIKLGTGCPP